MDPEAPKSKQAMILTNHRRLLIANPFGAKPGQSTDAALAVIDKAEDRRRRRAAKRLEATNGKP